MLGAKAPLAAPDDRLQRPLERILDGDSRAGRLGVRVDGRRRDDGCRYPDDVQRGDEVRLDRLLDPARVEAGFGKRTSRRIRATFRQRKQEVLRLDPVGAEAPRRIQRPRDGLAALAGKTLKHRVSLC